MKFNHFPDGWIEYELGELLAYEQPTPYIVESTEYNDKYPTPVLTAGKSFIIGYTNETDGIYNSLPVIIFDDFTTSSQFVNFEFKVKSSAMKILTANKELALPKFLYYLMQIINCDHSTHKRYWIQTYSKIRVAIPSLHEQERIVAKIEELSSELDKGVETLKKTKAQLKVHRQAVLKEAFEGKLTGGKLIRIATICDFATVATGATPLTSNSDYYGGDVPWVTSSALNNAFVKEPSAYITLKALEETNTKVFPAHTLLIAMYGEGKTRGKCSELLIDAATNQAVAAILINDDTQINRRYIKWYLVKNYDEIRRTSSGGVQPNLNLTKVRQITLPIYSFVEQCKIVAEIESRLSICDKIEQTVDEALLKAESLRLSILKKAFVGEL